MLVALLPARSLAADSTDQQGDTQNKDSSQPGILIKKKSNGDEYRIPEPCQPWTGQKLRIWDKTHHAISRSLCWPSRWFDHFFARPGDQIHQQAGTYLSITGATRWQDNGDTGDEVKVDARAVLPHAERRMSLLVSNDETPESQKPLDQQQPQQVGNNVQPGFRSALRVVLRTTNRLHADFDVGLQSRLKGFWRVRSRWDYQLPAGWFSRLEEKIYWEDPKGFGWRNRLDFDRPLTKKLTFRLSSNAELTELNNEEGKNWYLAQGATLFYQYSDKAAISYHVGVDGYTEPNTKVQTWYTSLRFRRNVWRPWFYYEVEPFVFFPGDDHYHAVSGIVFRVETQFGLYQ